MKKLISILMPLLLTGSAVAETIGGADAATSIVVAGETSLLSKGLIVTAGGLCGVFLVLILFFVTIKLMQKLIK